MTQLTMKQTLLTKKLTKILSDSGFIRGNYFRNNENYIIGPYSLFLAQNVETNRFTRKKQDKNTIIRQQSEYKMLIKLV